MIIHNKDHKVIMNYEWNWNERDSDYLFDFNNFRIINNLNIREEERTIQKQHYADVTFDKPYGDCKWKT